MVDKLLCEKVLWEYQVSAVVVGTGAGVDICTCTGAEIDDTTITTNLVIYTWRSATYIVPELWRGDKPKLSMLTSLILSKNYT